MPGDLRDQEQTYPFYYDNKYDPGTNPFEPGSPNLEGYIKSVVEEKGIILSPEKLKDLMAHLQDKGFLHRNPGDESFRNEIFKYLDKIQKAKKVASRWVRGLKQNG